MKIYLLTVLINLVIFAGFIYSSILESTQHLAIYIVSIFIIDIIFIYLIRKKGKKWFFTKKISKK